MLQTKLNDEEERYFKDTSKELELRSKCFDTRTYRAIEKTILMPLQYKYVHNIIDGRFENVEGVDRILGYESCRFTLDFYYQIMHPDDRKVTFEMTRKSISWANYNLPLKAEDMQLNVLQRIRKANDEYAYIFRQSIITAVVGNRIARTFSLCTNVTDMGMKTMKPAFLYVQGDMQFNHTKVFHKLNEEFKSMLTQREIDVLYWVLEGYTSFEIANKLNVSRHTIDTHRRNIRKKTENRTIPELKRLFFEPGS